MKIEKLANMLFVLVLLLARFDVIGGQTYRGSIKVKNVGQISTFTHAGSAGKNKYSILCSTYDKSPNSLDQVVILERPGRHIDSNFNGTKSYAVNGAYFWSKEVQQIPEKEFGIEAILIPDGSEVVGKRRGRLSMANITNLDGTASHDITTKPIPNLKASYQYTSAIFKQISLLGGKDILTCRANLQSGVYFSSELVHFKRPLIGNELTRPWSENILSSDACDGNFVSINFRYSVLSRWEALYAINSHQMELNLLWPETANGSMGRWDEPSQLNKLRLDTNRRYVDITSGDLNKDGKEEVIVSVASEWDGKGSLEVWKVPEDFRMVMNYTKIVIDVGFTPRVTGGTSPGVVKVFQPSVNHVGKPWILLSGGDDGRLYFYAPRTQSMNDWRYDKHLLLDLGEGHTVSGFAAADVDGDDVVEVFAAANTKDSIEVYSMKF